jgi:propanol-preferring alcohol dehydrogenase
MELVELARANKIRSQIEVYSLDEAEQVYERLAAGTISGRAVLVP